MIISFDISGAFNSAWSPKIIKHLIDKKCPKNLIETTKSYFSERKAKLGDPRVEGFQMVPVELES
jgi:hypothetical protein